MYWITVCLQAMRKLEIQLTQNFNKVGWLRFDSKILKCGEELLLTKNYCSKKLTFWIHRGVPSVFFQDWSLMIFRGPKTSWLQLSFWHGLSPWSRRLGLQGPHSTGQWPLWPHSGRVSGVSSYLFHLFVIFVIFRFVFQLFFVYAFFQRCQWY